MKPAYRDPEKLRRDVEAFARLLRGAKVDAVEVVEGSIPWGLGGDAFEIKMKLRLADGQPAMLNLRVSPVEFDTRIFFLCNSAELFL